MNVKKRKQLSIEVAKMYYIDRMTQSEIAETTSMSRSNISRILNKCIEDGTVEIVVHDTISSRPDVARRIQLAFSLKDVIIAPSGISDTQTAQNLGKSLALYLRRVLKSGMLLGVTKGLALYYAARNFDNKQNMQVDVVQLMGGTSPVIVANEGQILVSLFASKLNGTGYILNAPLMVKSKLAKIALLQDPFIDQVVKKFQDVNVCIFEIEKPYVHVRDYLRQPWLSRADTLQLEEVGVSACVCGYYYNENGNPCNAGIHDRLLAVDPKTLLNGSLNIGVATGTKTCEAVLSILRTNMVDVLFVDEALAVMLNGSIENLN